MKRSGVMLFGLTLILALVISSALHAPVRALKSGEQAQTITVSAAASLKDVLLEAQRNFEKQNKQAKILFNFGGSGTLEKQIEAGAPVDIFISADKGNIDKLLKKNLLIKDSVQDIASNKLVLVAYKQSSYKIKNIKDLVKNEIEAISLGTLGSVPAGDYAKEALTYYKLWDRISSKLVYAKDVSQVLNYVRLGNVDAGFVYYTDAKRKSDVVIKQVLPEESHSPILYEGAVTAQAQSLALCQSFMKYLKGSQAKIIFGKYGFSK